MIAGLILPLPSQSIIMGVLMCTILAPPTFAQAPVPETPTDSRVSKDVVANAVQEASQRFKVPVVWLRIVMRAESHGDTKSVSKKGAMGLMQVMPKTYEELRAKYGFGPDPSNPHDNILAGAAYLAELFSRYGSTGFLAAYNAGPRRYEEHLRGRPLPSETTDYVARLAPQLGFEGPLASRATAPTQALTAPIFFTAFALKPSNEMVPRGATNDASSNKKASPHPLFPAHSPDKIFADEEPSIHTPNAPKAVAAAPLDELFVAHSPLGAPR